MYLECNVPMDFAEGTIIVDNYIYNSWLVNHDRRGFIRLATEWETGGLNNNNIN